MVDLRTDGLENLQGFGTEELHPGISENFKRRQMNGLDVVLGQNVPEEGTD